MRKLDFHWMDNENWFHQIENGSFVVNDDAPPEAQDSYKRYLEQKQFANKQIADGKSLD